MTRRLYNTAVVSSLVLFVVVMGLWVASGFGVAVLAKSKPGSATSWFVGQHSGMIGAGAIDSVAYEHGFTFEAQPFRMLPPMYDEDTPLFLGLGYRWGGGWKGVIVPHWLLAILTLILPTVWLIRRRWHNPDPEAVPCVRCGYDLRGSQGAACPECGADHGPSTGQ